MFFALWAGPSARKVRFDRALDLHHSTLSASGWVGSLANHDFFGGSMAWDAESAHAQFAESRDGMVTLLGGYVADRASTSIDVAEALADSQSWGEFAAVQISRDSDGMTGVEVFADPAGSWPIYFGRNGHEVVVSNDAHMVGVALGFRALNPRVVYELATYSHAVGPDTSISGVKRLLIGERLRLLSGAPGVMQLGIESRPTYWYKQSQNSQATEEQLAFDGLVNGVKRMGPIRRTLDHATVQLSGGLDSRLTAGVLAKALGHVPQVVTLDLSDARELEIAASVAARLASRHRILEIDRGDSSTLRAGWLLTGGQVSPYAAAGNLLVYEKSTAAPNGEVVIVGAWPGDCLIGSYVPPEPLMTSVVLGRARARDWARKRGRHWSRREFFGVAAKKLARQSRRLVVRHVSQRRGLSAAQRISYWGMFLRQPAFSYCSPARLTTNVFEVTPVLARPYLESLLRLNGGQIYGKNFYRSLIARFLPELAAIDYAASGRPINSETVQPPLRPRSLAELYEWAPSILQRFGDLLIRMLRRGAIAPVANDTESAHWSRVLDELGAPDGIRMSQFSLVTSGKQSTHVRSIALAVHWTAEHLSSAAKQLGD